MNFQDSSMIYGQLGQSQFDLYSNSLNLQDIQQRYEAQPISATMKAKKRAYRANQSQEARERRMVKDAARHREYYRTETEEQKAARRARDAARHKEAYRRKKEKTLHGSSSNSMSHSNVIINNNNNTVAVDGRQKHPKAPPTVLHSLPLPLNDGHQQQQQQQHLSQQQYMNMQQRQQQQLAAASNTTTGVQRSQQQQANHLLHQTQQQIQQQQQQQQRPHYQRQPLLPVPGMDDTININIPNNSNNMLHHHDMGELIPAGNGTNGQQQQNPFHPRSVVQTQHMPSGVTDDSILMHNNDGANYNNLLNSSMYNTQQHQHSHLQQQQQPHMLPYPTLLSGYQHHTTLNSINNNSNNINTGTSSSNQISDNNSSSAGNDIIDDLNNGTAQQQQQEQEQEQELLSVPLPSTTPDTSPQPVEGSVPAAEEAQADEILAVGVTATSVTATDDAAHTGSVEGV